MAWMVVQALLVRSFLPGSSHRVALLKLFGASVGSGVVVKPGLHVKFPWRLAVGEHAWLGEDVWIDNLAQVTIGDHCCVSQGAYLCTGSHDWSASTFDLVTRPITIGKHAWIAAKCVVGPGVNVGEGSVLALGSVANRDLRPWFIHAGNPAVPIKPRRMNTDSPAKAARP
jgi:putative colanic acid biosynthesis acetyltransferase WcaF